MKRISAFLVLMPLVMLADTNKTSRTEKSPLQDMQEVYSKAQEALVVIECEESCGSGFVADFRDGKKYLVTNQHVIDGQCKIAARCINGNELSLGKFQYAKNADLVRFEIQDEVEALKIENHAPIVGEPIYVMGNSDGAGVVTPLRGAILGVGPSAVEISAKFVCGNSGSPVLNTNGVVVGVATYAVLHRDRANWLLEDSYFNGIRRFALRMQNLIWENAEYVNYSSQRKEVLIAQRIASQDEDTRLWLKWLNNQIVRTMLSADRIYAADEIMEIVRKHAPTWLHFSDAWGTPLSLNIISNQSYVASAGRDRHFGTSDDIVLTNCVAYAAELYDAEAEKAITRENRKVLEERLHDLEMSRRISEKLKQETFFELEKPYSVREFPCTHFRKDGAELYVIEMSLDHSVELFGYAGFKTIRVWLSARSGFACKIDLGADEPILRTRFDSIVKRVNMEQGSDIMAVRLEGEEESAYTSFLDDRGLYLHHDRNGHVSVSYLNQSLFTATSKENFEASELEKLPRLKSFLGVELDAGFMDMIKSMYALQKQSDVYMKAKFKPKERFLDFNDYAIEFSAKDGQIGFVGCTRRAPTNSLGRWLKWLMSQMEQKYGRRFAMSHDGVSWFMDFFEPKTEENKYSIVLLYTPCRDEPKDSIVVLSVVNHAVLESLHYNDSQVRNILDPMGAL